MLRISLSLICIFQSIISFADSKQKLYGESHYTYHISANALDDSTAYVHLGIHNSNPADSIFIDSLIGNYQFDTSFTRILSNGVLSKTHQLFNANNNVIETFQEVQNTNTGVWWPKIKLSYYYNSSNLLDSFLKVEYNVAVGKWINTDRIIYSYDVNGNTIRTLSQFWYNNKWDNDIIDSIKYNSTGKPVYRKRNAWNLGMLTFKDSTDLEYNTNGSLKRVLVHGYTEYIYEYSYDLLGNLYQDSSMAKTFPSTTWNKYLKNTYKYDNNNNRIECIEYNCEPAIDTFALYKKHIFTYDVYNRIITTVSNLAWRSDLDWYYSSGQTKLSYYYYSFPLAIADSKNSRQRLSLYPVPAVAYTNLEMAFDKTTNFTVSIFDMQGRVVKQFTDNAKGPYKKHVTVQDMPAGQYMLQVKTADETMSRNFTVIR